jgi:hypothetical protein
MIPLRHYSAELSNGGSEAKIEEVVAATTTAVQRGGRASGPVGTAQGLGLTLVVAAGRSLASFSWAARARRARAGRARRCGRRQEAGAGGGQKKAPDGPPVYHAFEPLVVNFESPASCVSCSSRWRSWRTIQGHCRRAGTLTPFLRNNLLLLIGSRDLKQL